MKIEGTSILAAGALLAVGMASGVWKWRAMVRSPERRAPMYVDILHRASLLYASATLVLGHLAAASAFSATLNRGAFWTAYFYFVVTLVVYAFHGIRRTERTMFTQRNLVTGPGVALLVVGELGSTLLLLVGAALGEGCAP
ncbi:hypothetical protein [Myxococcus virescens]|uniref:Uncharacterized protein n=1 Tax=Myxococcus virescens TaxID=83456 RepID=A0A511HLT0_9BACT|nr:hypothetical protein [Myxococcus virescens]GEL74530.1 hypothetical protein MVI01_63140 [Myxococcus virescens]SDD71091.1 hypothetical protein SAMN04488504_102373 [Myxococcus virescens]